MADALTPAIQECATCGTLIDVTDEQPLALRHCPNCGAAMRVRRIFNHFELQEILGAGGMGAVYRAHDRNLNRAVALKLLRAEHSQSPELIASFAKEAAITASINHPHVVKV
ncbi:MAG TPA: protein kinase, partial [Chthoniobacteraceae bacterium]|nr:protein kinase [Chthoniobacteraceae bacterium]